MIVPTSLTEQLLFTTIRIKVKTSSGQIGYGTGFFYNFENNGKKMLSVVTNKHVIKNSIEGEFHIHEAKKINDKLQPSGFSAQVKLQNFEDLWIQHDDNNVDLCAMPVAPLINTARKADTDLFIANFNKNLILPDNELNELNVVEDILMIGYPIGLSDEENNLPLIRKGITATHPAINFNGFNHGAVDIACFPGSSGSPIVLYNAGMYASKTGATRVGSRLNLIGILYAGPYWEEDIGIKIEKIPTQRRTSYKQHMIHLGYYIKAKELNNFGDFLTKVIKDGYFPNKDK